MSNREIALALSGGGIRAMVFHLGVMKAMAAKGLLERVTKLSTVSGGSLISGLIFQENQCQWPASDRFDAIYDSLRHKICGKSLMWGALRQLKNPLCLRYILSRANLLALALQNEWQVHCNLSDLPDLPEWSINGTTAQSGKRFRFKKANIGDYSIGYATTKEYPLAAAMAVSAAFPGGFGPLTLDAEKMTWYKREAWDTAPETERAITPQYPKLHLYDGGVYDNLGLEPFFDSSTGCAKFENTIIISSDAGKPMPRSFSAGPLNPFRLLRIADIMCDQIHALKIRIFMRYIISGEDVGQFIPITDTLDGSVEGCREADFASSFPTSLAKINYDRFDKIAGHGYNVAEKFLRHNKN